MRRARKAGQASGKARRMAALIKVAECYRERYDGGGTKVSWNSEDAWKAKGKT